MSGNIDNDDMNVALLSSDVKQGNDELVLRSTTTTTPKDFPASLKSSLDHLVDNLHVRVGLVPNYFMTRGEAILPTETFRSFEAFRRRALERTFKVFHQRDFREEQLYTDFEQTMRKVRDAVVHDSALKPQVAEVINSQAYKDGNSLLHILVKRRHLRFVRTLLLNLGDMVDLNLQNRHGYRPLDLALDRLEVEMIYLFFLHGVSGSTARSTMKSSLGYGEWMAYDLTVNLDTGRWLHKHSEEAIMKHSEACLVSETPEQLLKWAEGDVMGDETLSQLGRIPRLFTIVLADGCDAITNNEAWATTIRHLHFLRHETVASCNQIDHGTIKGAPEAVVCNDLYGFLKEQQADTSSFRTAGRTVFFHCHHDGSEIAVKLSKSLEDTRTPHPLAKEAAMNTTIAGFKQTYDLKSDYPVTISLLKLFQVPQEIRDAISSQQAAGYHPFQLSSDDDGVTALIYRPPSQYSLYVNDPSLALDVCRSGIEKAGYDSAVLARYGLYHGALVDIQHDSSREQRPHLWSFETFLTRFRGGAGRIERGFEGLGAPNVRASGLADLKHILTTDQVISRYDPNVFHAQHNILYNDAERSLVAEIEQLGSSVFAIALLAASCWQSRHANGLPESENVDLSQELQNCFSIFVSGYLQVDEEKALQFLRVVDTDFDRMAVQIKMFATCDYVRIAETARRRPIFGVFAKIFGWVTHPTAFVHFSQRGSMDLTTSRSRSLPEIRELYKQDATSSEFPRVDTSMMACSPTWARGKGWVSRSGQGHFGSYEGVLPFQQLIRDLYTVVHLAWLVRKHGNGAFELFA